MEANELRIGNLVSFLSETGDYPCYVETIVGLREIEKAIHDEDYFEGIPITEEWLLRFGFERGCPYSRESGFTFPCEGFFFEKDLNLVLEESAGRPITVVVFVHDLQNLYFALTGEELKLNEK